MNTLKWIAEVRKVSELKELPDNPRKITEDGYFRLKDRVTKRGFHDVIKLDTEDFILSGNQRKRVLVDLKYDEVNTLKPSRPLTEKEKKDIVVESNMNDGMFDFELLAGQFEIDELKDLGFTDLQLGLGKDLDIDNKEIDIDSVEAGLEKECPKCGFKF